MSSVCGQVLACLELLDCRAFCSARIRLNKSAKREYLGHPANYFEAQMWTLVVGLWVSMEWRTYSDLDLPILGCSLRPIPSPSNLNLLIRLPILIGFGNWQIEDGKGKDISCSRLSPRTGNGCVS